MTTPAALRFLLCTAVLFGIGFSAVGQQHVAWKWRDRSGQVHLSDMPPPADVPEGNILQRPIARSYVAPSAAASRDSAGAAIGAASAPSVDPELQARRRRAQEEKDALRKAQEDALATARTESCRRAQDYLRTLDNGMRIARVNEKGEREYLDDQQRLAETQRTQQIIASDCR